MKLSTPPIPELSLLYPQDDDDVASVAPTEVSQDDDVPARILQWEFHGLTLWLELEEFDSDLTNAIQYASKTYCVEAIPQHHVTAIYGMTHLSIPEACSRFRKIPSILSKWPVFDRPVSVKQDIAQVGRPGQVCNIAWAELTLSTNEEHESALDSLSDLFETRDRKGPWTPHQSIAYDNPEDSVLTLSDTIAYVAQHPTLLTEQRRVKAIALWSTQGKMADWECLDRVYFE